MSRETKRADRASVEFAAVCFISGFLILSAEYAKNRQKENWHADQTVLCVRLLCFSASLFFWRHLADPLFSGFMFNLKTEVGQNLQN